MIKNRQIVFILGAGASKAYGLPTAAGLLEKSKEDQSQAVRVALSRANIIKEWSDVDAFQKLLTEAHVFSVDRFLETREEPERSIGKALIAHELLKCETLDNLYGRGRLEQYQQEDWARWLFRYMAADDYTKFVANKVAFITFNYDNSLEVLLQRMINARFAQFFPIGEIPRRLAIVHLHGTLGVNGYEQAENLRNEPAMIDAIRKGINSIRVVADAQTDQVTDEFSRAHSFLRRADLVVFLGFGYDERNLARLRLHECLKPDARIIGTTWGLYGAEVVHDVIGAFDESLHDRIHNGVQLLNLTNVDLLRNHVHLFT